MPRETADVAEDFIDRAEIVALLFNVSDTRPLCSASSDYSLRTLAKRKLTKAEREEMERRHERAMANVRRTRELAERAQAKLDAKTSAD